MGAQHPAAWLVIRKVGILEDGTKIHEPRTYAAEDDRQKLKQSGLETAEYDLKGDSRYILQPVMVR